MNKIFKIQAFFSIVIYLMCFLFDAFYVHESQEPYLPLNLLSIGWLGFIGGHFSWFANPLYFIAYLTQFSKKNTPIILSFMAVILSSSFLLARGIIRDEGGGTATITAYGLGYYLWLLSFIMFFSGKLLDNLYEKGSIQKKSIPFIVFFQIVISIIIYVFLLTGINSHSKLLKDREIIFNQYCQDAKVHIIEKPRKFRGLLLKGNYSRNYYQIFDGHYKTSDSTSIGKDLLDYHLVEFYETENLSGEAKPYTRYTHYFPKGEWVDNSLSDYTILQESITDSLPKQLDISGYKISIVDNNTNNVISYGSVFTIPEEKKICDPFSHDGFSTFFLIKNLLSL